MTKERPEWLPEGFEVVEQPEQAPQQARPEWLPEGFEVADEPTTV